MNRTESSFERNDEIFERDDKGCKGRDRRIILHRLECNISRFRETYAGRSEKGHRGPRR